MVPRDRFSSSDALTLLATPVPIRDSLASLFRSSQWSAAPAPELYVPFSMGLFQHQASYPAYAGLFVSFQNKVLPTVFHSIPSIHPQVLASGPRVACHIPGLCEALPSLLFVSHGIWTSVFSVLVVFIADGWDAMRSCGASQFYLVTRPSYYYFVPYPPLVFRRVSSVRRWCCQKGVLNILRASKTPAGRSVPHVWLNLSYSDGWLAISCRLSVDLDLLFFQCQIHVTRRPPLRGSLLHGYVNQRARLQESRD